MVIQHVYRPEYIHENIIIIKEQTINHGRLICEIICFNLDSSKHAKETGISHFAVPLDPPNFGQAIKCADVRWYTQMSVH